MSAKPRPRKDASKEYSDILFEVKDQVAWVTINRPRVLNAFREQTLDQMIEVLKSTREDPTIVCAVVTGAGDKAFSAGGDIHEQRENDRDYTQDQLDARGAARRRGSYDISACPTPRPTASSSTTPTSENASANVAIRNRLSPPRAFPARNASAAPATTAP